MGSLQTLFNNDKRLAILPNVGPLIMPTTKAQFYGVVHPKPASLFSHQRPGQHLAGAGSEGATRGWGDRMGDVLAR